MGYNALILIQNRDIDKIAADPNFGRNVANLLRGADQVIQKKSGFYNGLPVSLSEIKAKNKEADVDYDVQGTAPQHADLSQLFLIQYNNLTPVPFYGNRMSFEDWKKVCLQAKHLGIESKLGSFDTRKEDVYPEDAANGQQEDFSEEAFNSASTAITILIDGLNEIEKSTTFGEDLTKRVRGLWAAQKNIRERINNGEEFMVSVNTDVSVRNFSNPVSVIDFVPAGKSDLMIVSHNYGRSLRNGMSVHDQVATNKIRIKELRALDVKDVGERLSAAGFSVRMPGKTRMSQPRSWNSDTFVKEPESNDLSL